MTEGRVASSRNLLQAAGLAWVVCFLYLFYSASLFGTGDSPDGRLKRFDVLAMAVAVTPDNLFVDAGRRLFPTTEVADRWRERGPIAGFAIAVVASALFLGGGLLRFLFGTHRPLGAAGWTFAFGLGMGLISLFVLATMLMGVLDRHLAWKAAVVCVGCWLLSLVRGIRAAKPQALVDWPHADAAHSHPSTQPLIPPTIPKWLPWIITPFVLLSFLASMLPTTDFDALGYHLLAPKEWRILGRMEFLPHNVYACFPFLTEMFPMLGMSVLGQWFYGGLAGQTILWFFAPAGALAVAGLANQLFGKNAGWLAAVVYLSTPWIFRLSTIPYVEAALLFYATAAVLAVVDVHRSAVATRFVAGAMIGCSAACKYTALVTIGVPIAGWILWQGWSAKQWRPSMAFTLGVAVFLGPWLARNVAWTGNPVYPLAYNLFGGSQWSTEQAERFAAGHRSTDFSLPAFTRYLTEIPIHSDWQSGLIFAFAPLAFVFNRARSVVGLWLLVAYAFLAFWLLTHRLDRFWLPLLPFAVVLAAGGWNGFRGWFRTAATWLAVGAAFINLAYCTTKYCTLNDYLARLADHGRRSRGIASTAVQMVDESGVVKPDSGVLYVGFAGVYYSEHPVYYNTVFNLNLLEQWSKQPDGSTGTRSPADLRRELARRGVQFIMVDWNWVEEYRKPGNYGFTDFIARPLFEKLTRDGVLLRMLGDEKRMLELYKVQPQIEQAGSP